MSRRPGDIRAFVLVPASAFAVPKRSCKPLMYQMARATRTGEGAKAGANNFGESNEARLQRFGAVHKPRGTVMQTEHAARLEGTIPRLWVGRSDRVNTAKLSAQKKANRTQL